MSITNQTEAEQRRRVSPDSDSEAWQRAEALDDMARQERLRAGEIADAAYEASLPKRLEEHLRNCAECGQAASARAARPGKGAAA